MESGLDIAASLIEEKLISKMICNSLKKLVSCGSQNSTAATSALGQSMCLETSFAVCHNICFIIYSQLHHEKFLY